LHGKRSQVCGLSLLAQVSELSYTASDKVARMSGNLQSLQEIKGSRQSFSGRPILLFLLITFSLTVSLATRTFHFKTHHGTSVQSVSSSAIRQHLDKDAVRWPAPVETLAMLDSPALLLDESLYNRPPPSC
jgi:hypothetical protein